MRNISNNGSALTTDFSFGSSPKTTPFKFAPRREVLVRMHALTVLSTDFSYANASIAVGDSPFPENILLSAKVSMSSNISGRSLIYFHPQSL